MFEQLLLGIISLVANTLSALAGGGAGLLQLPALSFLGLSFATALATHKIASVFLGVGATIKHMKASTLQWPLALLILCAGVPGVITGTQVILLVPDQIALALLSLLTFGLGLYSILNKQLGMTVSQKNRHIKGYLLGALGLYCFGFLNGSLTSGTGLFVTLWMVRWFGLDYKQAVAYSLILVGLFWNGAGAVSLALQTTVQWDWLPVLIVASLAGGYIGSHLAIVKGNKLIKIAYEITTIITSISLMIKVIISL